MNVNTNNNSAVYCPPEIKAIEIKCENIICTSLDGNPRSNPWDDGSNSTGGLGGDD